MIAAALGYSRGAYYKQQADGRDRRQQEEIIRQAVCRERKLLPRIGTRKLQRLIGQQGVRCGRDRLFRLMRGWELLSKPKKRYLQTTMSRHWMRKYPNLVRTMPRPPEHPEELWVSDITYLKTEEGYCYLSLVTDAYSRKIVGYHVGESLDAEQTRRAFQMALSARVRERPGLIHHSDRGQQYCSSDYVQLAETHQVRLSMTENGDPYENALAERMNRTLKEEFCLEGTLPSRALAKRAVEEAIHLYNTYRPHQALGGATPEAVHQQQSR